jgi:hypothetical protein
VILLPYIEPEIIIEAKKLDLLTYLQNYEPQELVRFCGNTYTTKTHDSLKISNGKWMWWSRGIGGKSALDYLIKVKDYSFIEAVETIMGKSVVKPSIVIKREPEKPKELLLPDKSASTNKIFEYLYGRGIDYSIIGKCVRDGIIFESLPYHNLVFIGKDNTGKPKYAAYRATNKSRIMGDCSGSDKHYSFRLADGKSNSVHLFESAIDLLSYATLLKLDCKDYENENLISLAGVYAPKDRIEESKVPVALEEFLKERPNISTIYLHLDSDKAGRLATKALQTILKDSYEVIDDPAPQGKDFNDFLCFRLGIERNQPHERSYEH